LLRKEHHEKVTSDLSKMEMNALVVGPDQKRNFTVDFSKHEFTGKQEVELENYTIYVYSPAMLAIEKIIAICQQEDKRHQCVSCSRPKIASLFRWLRFRLVPKNPSEPKCYSYRRG
jgi:hypothetical protein